MKYRADFDLYQTQQFQYPHQSVFTSPPSIKPDVTSFLVLKDTKQVLAE